MFRPCLRAVCWKFCTAERIFPLGTTTSSLTLSGPRLNEAGLMSLLISQIRSSSSCMARSWKTVFFRTDLICITWFVTQAVVPSTRTMSALWLFSGQGTGPKALRHVITSAGKNSRAQGRRPSLKISLTPSRAMVSFSKQARTVAEYSGSGKSLSQALTIMPRVPSDPVNRPVKSRPTTFL